EFGHGDGGVARQGVEDPLLGCGGGHDIPLRFDQRSAGAALSFRAPWLRLAALHGISRAALAKGVSKDASPACFLKAYQALDWRRRLRPVLRQSLQTRTNISGGRFQDDGSRRTVCTGAVRPGG